MLAISVVAMATLSLASQLPQSVWGIRIWWLDAHP
jgi:hypothetical protein